MPTQYEKYDKYLDSLNGEPGSEEELFELASLWDWGMGKEIDWIRKKQDMLLSLKEVCYSCVLCELCKNTEAKGERINPHVFSNMQYSRWMVVGQNPGFDEVKIREPFTGISGDNFDSEIRKHDVKREEFYITNITKCYTQNNAAPSSDQKQKCRIFLDFEIKILNPRLIITFGAPAFQTFFPNTSLTPHVNKIKKCEFGGREVKIFPIFHPSPKNIRDQKKLDSFRHGIKLLCGLTKKIKDD